MKIIVLSEDGAARFPYPGWQGIPPDTERNRIMKAIFTRCALTFAAAAVLMLGSAGGAGETVDGLLKVHVVLGETADGAGGFHLHAQVKLQGVGIGTVTGDSYRLHADEPFIFVGDRINDTAGGAFNGAISFNVDAIGMGDAPNFHGTFRFQVTENANGVLTMEKGVMTETCN
jgi:hypothetical protein